jgi:hypothetical protein
MEFFSNLFGNKIITHITPSQTASALLTLPGPVPTCARRWRVFQPAQLAQLTQPGQPAQLNPDL